MTGSPAPDMAPARGGLVEAARRFLALLPALVLACACVRLSGLYAALPGGSSVGDALSLLGQALRQDVLALARYLPGLFLLSLPCLLGPARGRLWPLGLLWSLLLLLQWALQQYFATTRVPLGADLFAYSWHEIVQVTAAGADIGVWSVLALLLPLACLWAALAWRRSARASATGTTVVVFAVALLALLLAPPRWPQQGLTEDAYQLAVSKPAWFFDDSLRYLLRTAASSADATARRANPAPPAVDNGPQPRRFHYLDPQYPFLRLEDTPDVLGPYFEIDPQRPPDIVLVIVEGLGRSFSGPDARLGSFTPFLDSLIARSLYWDNFLATQGRTFAVLPSVLGSLPFADNGFNALDARMPAQAQTLTGILARQGYAVDFYAGTDLDFDNQRAFLQHAGVQRMYGADDFGSGYVRANDWGYGDGELLAFVLARLRAADAQPQPRLSVIQTITMHTPYTFPGQAGYTARFEQRLRELDLDARQQAAHRAQRDIYTSILYVDDALRRFFEQRARDPAWANTIFIVTGDHRLPEIPMATRLERYHVPLLVFSPLLKRPARMRAVSSHFDIVPTLLALLAHHCGIRTPRTVTWLGPGLDTAPYFRSLQDIALKQTKASLADFVAGDRFLDHGQLYAIGDRLDLEPLHDEAALAQARARFERFRTANAAFAANPVLMPARSEDVAYDQLARARISNAPPPSALLAVQDLHLTQQDETLLARIGLRNRSARPSATFVPLLVLATADGREVGESSSPALQLDGGQARTVQAGIKLTGLAPGEYFASALVTDPQSGRRIGSGRYHVKVTVTPAPAGNPREETGEGP